MFTKEIIDGVLKLVRHIKYSDGKIVKRIHNAQGELEDAITIAS